MNTQPAYNLGELVGDGIGPEIVHAAVTVVDAAVAASGPARIEWTSLPVGRDAIDEFGTALPETTLSGLTKMDGWLLGPHDSAAYPPPHNTRLNPSGAIRSHFDLFANLRPARAFPGTRALLPGTDIMLVRENTEGFYADRNTFAGTGEFMPTSDVAIASGIVTRCASERIARTAFEHARKRRGRVTIVHKANVLRLTNGLFREACRSVAQDYPDVDVNEYHIDAVMVHLLRRTSEFDVIVTENMFGDILSDLTAEIAGSLGLAPSINASTERAMAQAAHGSAPDIAGHNLANPLGMILSSGMLLDWLGERHGDESLSHSARAIETAVASTLHDGIATPDMGGSATTTSLTEAVIQAILR